MIEIQIDETRRNSLKEDARIFNQEHVTFKTIEEVKNYLIERYGKIPNRKNKVYIDKKDGSTQEIGFTYSYWNRDISHYPCKAWYQTDWVVIYNVNKEPILLNA